MILVDTTILVYAVGVDHPLRDPTRRFVEMVGDGVIRARTTVEMIQEFAHVRARRRPRADAVAVAVHYAQGLAPLVSPDREDLREGLDLFERVEALGAFDAVLAATALRRGWALAPADRSFARAPRLLHLDPASPAFLAGARDAG
ncbi:MAG: type II toxin-antitoxin system VapC family toxin [Acidimicrobiales bacterium]